MKIDITKIDPNFKSPDADFENTETYNVLNEPFEIKGIYFDGEKFVRMPKKNAGEETRWRSYQSQERKKPVLSFS